MNKILRKRIIVKGVVQGVGFRPAVYRLASARKLSGWVKNDASGVTIEAQGPSPEVALFIGELRTRRPPASRIDSVSVFSVRPAAAGLFEILKSGGAEKAGTVIPADLALCGDCRREMLAPGNRRYLYPFTNCTNCGPRFTIVRSVPYDRPLTTMAPFRMCPECLSEYNDPHDRRFHAQPNACSVCGPAVTASAGVGRRSGPAALKLAAGALMRGEIAAIQSLGGFHLACDACDPKAVARLRGFKDRPAKPFAVMTASSAEARKFCFISQDELAILESAAAPVVALRKKRPGPADLAAPGLGAVGVMLAYTPLHAALFKLLRDSGFGNPLIMTSGNRRDEPIAKDLHAAKKNLGGMAGLILSHDREIHNRADDSVGFYARGALRLVRRARGFTPEAIKIGGKNEGWKVGGFEGLRGGGLEGWKNICALGCGGDIKNAFCLTRGGEAFLSQHIGDLGDCGNQAFLSESLEKMKALLKVKPALIAHDLHPDYHSSNFARSLKGVKVPVQHHAAHVLGAAAEHSFAGPFIGVAWDGAGYGSDGKIWGSEFLVVKNRTWRRAAHLKYFALPGGDAAAKEVWRSALSLLMTALGPRWREKAGSLFLGVNREKLALVERLALTGVNVPLTSGMGRLFDAVAFLAGLGEETTYEGQGPMELESLCGGKAERPYEFDIRRENGRLIIDPAKALLAAAAERGPGRARHIAERFHTGLAGMLAEVVSALKRETGIRTVVLSGGVFQNRFLLELCWERLERRGFKVLAGEKVPANDGGLSLGQVYYALNGFKESAS